MNFRRFMKSVAQVFSLVLIDILAYYVALFLAVLTRTTLIQFMFKNIPPFFLSFQNAAELLWVPLVFLMMNQFERLYLNRVPFWEEARSLLKTSTISILLITLVIYFSAMFGPNTVLRIVFVFLWIFSIIIFPLFRFLGKQALFKLGVWKENVIILGCGPEAIATIRGLKREDHLGYKVLGFLDDDPANQDRSIDVDGTEYKVLGEIKNFTKFVNMLDIQTVFIAVRYENDEKLAHIINNVYRYVKRVILIPEIHGVSVFNSELHYLYAERLFMIRVRNSLKSKFNMFIKRIFDLVLSLAGFVVILPFFLLVAFLVKITSKGGIFYGHPRVGKDGKEFKAWKFRTMYYDSEERLKHILATDPKAKKEWKASFKMKNDPRITPLGKLLRKTSMDELPQIINILVGQMSLVGPRPVVREELESHYGDFAEYYYSVKPGLTGLWQVSGRSDTDYHYRVQTDAWYVQNWNLWLDIIILFRTPLAVLRGKGAY
ncbi:MAG: hypothetical protein A2Y33_04055 [Spirochaetes bacterium GWF1_51_8]|nr:MAG: hypothetical protein A2Y33_04055 [Spirochaetes bacterium GWF1_51_8]